MGAGDVCLYPDRFTRADKRCSPGFRLAVWEYGFESRSRRVHGTCTLTLAYSVGMGQMSRLIGDYHLRHMS